MTNTKTTVAALVIGILALLGVGYLAFHGGSAPAFGNTINPNPQGFPQGIAYGNLNSLWLSDQLVLAAGQNQFAWKNLTGSTVLIQMGHVTQTGTASSTYKVYVGTSTTATVTDSFVPATAPFWSQFVDGFSISTGTPSGVWADNFVNHKTGYPAEIQVPANQYLIVVASSFCTTVGSCETATSTNRGWTLKIPFRYIAAGTN